MKFVKRLTALILVFTFCSSVCSVNMIHAANSFVDKDAENIELLLALGIIEPERFSEYDSDKYMSRLEFAGVLGNMFKLAENSTEQIFSDVPLATENAGYIGTAYEMGIFSGDGSGRFRPYDSITYFEAVKSLLYAAGHGDMIGISGSNIWGYAQDQKLTKGISHAYGDKMKRADMAELLVNALDLKVVYTEKYYKFFATNTVSLGKTTDSENTVLTYIMELKRVKGIVTANEFTSIDNGLTSVCKENQIRIEGEVYDADGYADFLGMHVVAYVTDVDDEDSRVVYAAESDKTKTITLKHGDFKLVDGKIEYEENKRTKKLRLSDSVSVIYNEGFLGKLGTTYVDADSFKISSGNLLLIDNNDDGSYEVCRLTEYDYAYILEADAAQGIFVDAYTQTRIAFNDDKCKYEFFYEDKPCGLEKITQNSVLTMVKSTNGEYCRVYITDKTVNGTVTKTEKDDGREYVVIDGTYYLLSSYWLNLVNGGNTVLKPFTSKDTGKFYMTYDGEVAAFVSVKDNYYGYVLDMRECDDDSAWVKMYTEDGRFEKFYTTEKVYVTESGVRTKLNPGAAVGKLKKYDVIQYRLNENREIREIQFSQYSKNGSNRTFTNNVKKLQLQCYDGVLGAAYSVGSATTVFNVPDPLKCSDREIKDPMNYSMTSSFGNSNNYTVDVYNLDEYRTAGIIVNYRSPGGETPGNGYTSPMIVQDVSEVFFDDEICIRVEGLVSGKTKVFYCSDLDLAPNKSRSNYIRWDVPGFKPCDIKVGDVILYTTKGNDYLNSYLVMFRPDAQKDPVEIWTEGETVPENKQRAEMYTAFGKVRAVNDIQLVYTVPNGEKVLKFPSWGFTYLVNLDENTVEATTKAEVHSGDMVFLQGNYGNLYTTVIYRQQ